MKKLLLSLLILLAPIVLDAQSIRYRGDVGMQVGTSMFYWKGYYRPSSMQAFIPGATINTTHGIEWNETITAGVGVGIGPACAVNHHSDPFKATPLGIITLYANFDYAFQRGNPIRPFVGTRIGYEFALTKNDAVGFPDVGAGVGIRLNERWDLAAWYRLGLVLGDNAQLGALLHTPILSVSWRF